MVKTMAVLLLINSQAIKVNKDDETKLENDSLLSYSTLVAEGKDL